MLLLLFSGFLLLTLGSSAPINSKSDLLAADLHMSGTILATLIRKNAEFRGFAQRAMPIALNFTLTADQQKTALLRAYNKVASKKLTREEKKEHIDKAIALIQEAKKEKVSRYFERNLDAGNRFFQECGILSVSDAYVDGTDAERQQMLKNVIEKYQEYL